VSRRTQDYLLHTARCQAPRAWFLCRPVLVATLLQ
jgi:hypothetical protein